MRGCWTPRRTPTVARRGATRSCSGRPVMRTCTSPMACIFASTLFARRREPPRRCSSGPAASSTASSSRAHGGRRAAPRRRGPMIVIWRADPAGCARLWPSTRPRAAPTFATLPPHCGPGEASPCHPGSSAADLERASAARRSCRGDSGSAATQPSRPTARTSRGRAEPLRRSGDRAATLCDDPRGGAVTDVIDELTWRGLVALSTDPDALRGALVAAPATFYCGFDPTAPGLHVGNLVQLLTVARIQRAGHRPIGLVGGATGLIGDPSGRSAERTLNAKEVVAEWVERIRHEVARFVDFGPGPTGALLVSNLDWTAELTALDFLRDIGKHFSVNQMLARESVRARLEGGGISYTEFSYQILQANDYLELYRRHGCTLQVGGSDQWGNLVAGVDLIRRVEGRQVHALATPLITKPDGTKYGKTEGGAIWLDPGLTSPYAFYQFWINRSDAEVPVLLRVFTFRTREEIEVLEREAAERPAAGTAQRTPAEDVTTMVDGRAECQKVVAASRALFGQGEDRKSTR